MRLVLGQRGAGSTDDARPAQILDMPQGCGQKINLHGLAADFAFQLGQAGLGLAAGFDAGPAAWAASWAGKGALGALALDLGQPMVELFAFHFELTR